MASPSIEAAMSDEAASAPAPFPTQTSNRSSITHRQAWSLYTSHLLSTWNARAYEFAAVVFTAAAWPDTLTANAVRGIVTTLCSICFTAMVGRWIDRSPDRLRTLVTTITFNRGAVICATLIWPWIVAGDWPLSASGKVLLFAGVLLLDMVEKLSGAGNLMSMERDWVVIVAAPAGQPFDLTHLNSSMRRIDLICKLVAPIFISIIISTFTVTIGIYTLGFMSLLSWAVEVWCARRVWNEISALQVQRPSAEANTRVSADMSNLSLPQRLLGWSKAYLESFERYFASSVWIPSFSLSLLYFTVLTYSGTLITHLLAIGYSLTLITVFRALGSIIEISSTVATPFGVQWLSRPRLHGHGYYHVAQEDNDEDEDDIPLDTDVGLQRFGLWGIVWQLVNLIPVVLALWTMDPTLTIASRNTSSHSTSAIVLFTPFERFGSGRLAEAARSMSSVIPISASALLLFVFLSLSRFGLWIYDLTTQQLTQTHVPANQLSSFAGVEQSFIGIAELGVNVAAIVLNQPADFKYLALGSLMATGLAALLYAGWVWHVRGHLVHWEKIRNSCHCTVHP